MSDGSYDEKRAFDVSFCAAMTRCELTGYTALVIWAERSVKFSTDNYQAEILGAIALQLLIKTAWGIIYQSYFGQILPLSSKRTNIPLILTLQLLTKLCLTHGKLGFWRLGQLVVLQTL